jgi:hypothetical protein
MNLCKAGMSEKYILVTRIIQGDESDNLKNKCSALKVVAEDGVSICQRMDVKTSCLTYLSTARGEQRELDN